jgi:outer membrane murein-binding lipoprotein Lpp
MKKKFIGICAASVILLAGCTSNNKSNESCNKDGDLNPNGSSELSLIMRKMATHLAENRDALKAGKGIVPAPKEIDNLLTAKKTDEEIDKTIYDGYAKLYQQRIIELNESADSADSIKIKAHNNLVSTCRDCHSNFCPGPMVVINQLDIK